MQTGRFGDVGAPPQHIPCLPRDITVRRSHELGRPHPAHASRVQFEDLAIASDEHRHENPLQALADVVCNPQRLWAQELRYGAQDHYGGEQEGDLETKNLVSQGWGSESYERTGALLQIAGVRILGNGVQFGVVLYSGPDLP